MCVYVGIYVHTCHGIHVLIRGHVMRILSFLHVQIRNQTQVFMFVFGYHLTNSRKTFAVYFA